MKDKIKIAFVSTPNYPIPAVKGGAIETLVSSLIDENEKIGKYDFTVFTIEDMLLDGCIQNLQNTKIIQIPHPSFCSKFIYIFYKIIRKLLFYKIPPKSFFMSKVNSFLANEKFDIVFFESTLNEVLQANKITPSRFVFHVHSDYLTNSTPGIMQIFKKCDAVVGVSNFITRSIQNISGSELSTFYTLHNAVDVESILASKSSISRNSIRQKFHIENDEIVILYCSRLSPEKGILELIKAVQKVDNCRLMVVGGANFSSSKVTPYVKELQKIAADLGDKVLFTGYVDHAHVYDYMKAADIAVVPSICNEAASLTLLEFRASNLATVASNRGGIPEYCSSETTVLVNANPDFVKNLSQAISLLVNNVDLREKMSAKSTDDLAFYNYQSYFKRFSDLVDKIIK